MKIFDITLFGIQIAPSYYGLMYAMGFIFGYLILKRRKFLAETELDSLVTYIFFGVILGGRLGYILFYDFSYYLSNPSQLFAVWKGGMSFHGGAIGVIIAMYFFAKKYKKSYLKITDNIVTILPIGLGLGRIGNYLNKELLGRTYSGFLAVEKDGAKYFPSPLLEALLEGLVLYFILNYIFKKSKTPGETSGAFLTFYAVFRFLIEFIRVPDIQLGYIFNWLTMGQILSIPMFIVGIYFWLFFNKNSNE
ncbi:MAG: prolipoprotein diacylglyceryl transferase [Candidatus Gracilibacteria bacterium]|nr:prolipoprotein diacylglyceryl transferase [Candidatus Gracilibacteria bacterium]MDD2908269.1 prolipoprotein diacylglyceryl transferase [Candidatus Gracilibacteria bacterium]